MKSLEHIIAFDYIAGHNTRADATWKAYVEATVKMMTYGRYRESECSAVGTVLEDHVLE